MAVHYPIYLDNNATTPCDPQVLEAMLPYFTQKFGNAASRNHAFGWEAAEAVDIAREQVAALIGAEPNEIVFTSGATEANNLAIQGAFESYAGKGTHIITCVTEHPAVLDTCRQLEKKGAATTYLPVDASGLISLQELEAAITPQSILIAIMYANNETGVIQPTSEIAAIAKKHELLFFSDAVQAAGKIPVDVQGDGIDIMSLSAHKMYGPKGVGALYVRRRNPRVKLAAQIHGGGQERGQRSGTLNVPAIVGLGKACELARLGLQAEARRTEPLRNQLEHALLQLEETFVNGHASQHLSHVCNIGFKHVDAEALLMACNRNLALSTGSACSSASLQPSHVLKAMGLSDEMAYGCIRIGLGGFTTAEEIEVAVQAITKAVIQQRELSPAWQIFKKEEAV